jgi:alcohol dehydrogenase
MADTIHSFLTTPVVFHGPGALARLPWVISQLGSNRPVIVTDPGLVKAGILSQVLKALGAEVPTFTDVEPDPPDTLVARCSDFLRSQGADLVIGLGGGSAIDVAKLAAVMLGNEGQASDYYGVEKVPNPGAPFVAIPTTAGTGSEVTPAAVFSDTATHTKKGVRSSVLQPKAAILDPLLTLSVPPAVTAATGIDALTHAIEAYTSRDCTMLNQFFAEKAVFLISRHLYAAYSNGSSVTDREGMLMGSYLAGLSFAIANVAAVHAIAQTIGGLYPVPHGVANAVMLPYVMEFNQSHCADKYARIGELMGLPRGTDATVDAAKTVSAVRDLTRSVGIPQSLPELEIPAESIDTLAERCVETQGRLLVLNPRETTVDDIRGILRRAYEQG